METQENTPPKFTFGQAQKTFTISKSTLSKDRKSGKLSAEKQPDGSYRVNRDELERVYGDKLKLRTAEKQGESNTVQPPALPQETVETQILQIKLAAVEKHLGAAEAQIVDLRDDRDKWRQQATALLVDQRPKRRSWWPFSKE